MTVSDPVAECGGRGTAEVEERELLKAMSWWDGFMIALANPGFLIAALGGSIATAPSRWASRGRTVSTRCRC